MSLVRYDVVEEHIARIVLARPEARNAQNLRLLYELDETFQQAAQDDHVRVIVLSGQGPDFCAGHDLKERASLTPRFDEQPTGLASGLSKTGLEGMWAREDEAYLGLFERWRQLPKPTIAQVHGKVIGAGLILAWCCDLIVAAEDTIFQEPAAGVGLPGGQVFGYPWELGFRKALELLYTADPWTAQEAHRLGMVNHVVPAAELEPFCLSLARRIASKSSFALRLVKEAVLRTAASQGRDGAIRSAFYLHQVALAQTVFGGGLGDLSAVPEEIRRHWASVQADLQESTPGTVGEQGRERRKDG